MDLVDVHCHLEHKKFKKDLDNVIKNAKKAGLKLIIESGVNPETNREALEISKKYGIKASFGLYPIDALMKEIEEGKKNGSEFLREVKEFDVDEELKWIEEHKDDCVAIGEVGLDYNWPEFQGEKERKMQKDIFEKIIKFAIRIDKPLVIHSRKAELDAIELLEKYSRASRSAGATTSPKTIMHCFSGKKSLIKRAADNGWYFSIPPVIKRLQHFQMLVEIVPISQLLTETDSPYLSPVVGERNEPANVAVTIEEIARIKKISKEDVAEQIFANAKKVFNL